MPLGLLNPGEFFANPSGSTGPSTGQNTDFNSAVSGAVGGAASGAVVGAFSGAYNAAGYGSVASGLTAVTGTIGVVTAVTSRTAIFNTCPSGGGCRLPSPATVPYPVYIGSFGASGLSVFPPNSGSAIGAGSAGAASLQATGTVLPYHFAGGNQYYVGT